MASGGSCNCLAMAATLSVLTRPGCKREELSQSSSVFVFTVYQFKRTFEGP